MAKVKKYEQDSNQVLWERLAAIDPQESTKIHPNNRKRVWRALEYYFQTGTLKIKEWPNASWLVCWAIYYWIITR
nr:hypothetical protein [Spiroplasma endosymbiont of Phyllotreta cruciferae]